MVTSIRVSWLEQVLMLLGELGKLVLMRKSFFFYTLQIVNYNLQLLITTHNFITIWNDKMKFTMYIWLRGLTLKSPGSLVKLIGFSNLAMENWYACEQEMLLSINLSFNEDAKMLTRSAMEMWIVSGKISSSRILILRTSTVEVIVHSNKNRTQRSFGLWS